VPGGSGRDANFVTRRGTARQAPKPMTVAVIVAGLLPIFWGHGDWLGGDEPYIAAPMVGGMITAPLLSMFVIPAAVPASCEFRASGAPVCGPRR